MAFPNSQQDQSFLITFTLNYPDQEFNQKTKLITTLATLALFFANTSDAARIKDLTSVKGARDNQLRGVGLVVGLAGQGDGRIEPTERSIINAMERFGLDITQPISLGMSLLFL